MRHRAAQGTAGRTAAAVVAWVVGAACAVGVGALALSLIGSSLGDRSRPPLAAQIVAQPSASSSPTNAPPVRPSPKPSPRRSATSASRPASPSAQAVERAFSFDAGSVTARCTGDLAYLVSWSPAQGYRAEDVHRGPSFAVGVEFEAFTTEAEVSVRCVAGIPRASINRHRR